MQKSTDPRHQARRVALKTLFEWSFLSRDPGEILQENFERFNEEQPTKKNKQTKIDTKLATNLTLGVIKTLEEVDGIIIQCASEWPISQIDKIDLAILRLAIFELKFTKSTPQKVSIDEAVELGKEFGGENSGKFINGVLGTVVKEIK